MYVCVYVRVCVYMGTGHECQVNKWETGETLHTHTYRERERARARERESARARARAREREIERERETLCIDRWYFI